MGVLTQKLRDCLDRVSIAPKNLRVFAILIGIYQVVRKSVDKDLISDLPSNDFNCAFISSW